MDVDHAMLYEDFQQARAAAVELTDRYRAVPHDDPCKDALWRDVVSRTVLAQRLLKRWLDEVDTPELSMSAR